mmetsp:Transcript_22396/g.60074  ORF Transcript_22396/g.60074 Transcript_22396/m.60074 type:complete len:309 (+) Transcript_22396:453-1379(+)
MARPLASTCHGRLPSAVPWPRPTSLATAFQPLALPNPWRCPPSALQPWLGAREQLEDLEVLVERLGDHLRWQLERRRLVEVDRLEVVAHVLLVERVLLAPHLVPLLRPVPRAVGCEHLIAEHERRCVAAGDRAKLHLGVGDEDAARLGEGGGELIDLLCDRRHRRARRLAQDLVAPLDGDVLVVVAQLRLGRRREQRRRQLRAVLQARGQRVAADAARLLVVDPPRPRDVPADDRLHRQHRQLAHEHRTAVDDRLVLAAALGHLVDVRGDHVVGDALGLEQLHPEDGQLRQDLALARNTILHHHVERR